MEINYGSLYEGHPYVLIQAPDNWVHVYIEIRYGTYKMEMWQGIDRFNVDKLEGKDLRELVCKVIALVRKPTDLQNTNGTA